MKRRCFFMLAILCFLACVSCVQKNYSVRVDSSARCVKVKMHCPRVGVVRLGRVDYDGFTLDEVEKKIFDGIRRKPYDGDYDVYVTMQSKDQYGHYVDENEVKVSTLNGAEVKRYASFSSFRGRSNISSAYNPNIIDLTF